MYSIELLLRFYQPLDIPKTLFTLEVAEQRNEFKDRPPIFGGDCSQGFERRHRGRHFGGGGFNQVTGVDSFSSNRNFRGGYSWRRGIQKSVGNSSQEVARDSDKMASSWLKQENGKDIHSIVDLERDMSSIGSILGVRFEKNSTESERFIRHKLVEALGQIDGTATSSGGKMPFNSMNVKHINRDAFGGNKMNEFSYMTPENLFFGRSSFGEMHMADSKSMKSPPRMVPEDAPLHFSPCQKSSFACYKPDRGIHMGIGAGSLKPLSDILDEPIWMYKDAGSNVVNGPFSTKQMNSLWRNYLFTHNTMFRMAHNIIWGPINLFYPEVK